MTLDLFYGNAVSGSQRFSRPELEARFIKIISNSSGIKMFGLRRIGKSTMRLYAMEHFRSSGKEYAYIDGQGLRSLNDLLGRLFEVMPGEKSAMGQALKFLSKGPVNKALEAVSTGAGCKDETLSVYWRLISDAIRDALNNDGENPILIIDEFSYLIYNMVKSGEDQDKNDADKLLASMREWRDAGLTMLLTGSIGLTGLTREYGLNIEHLNDLRPFTIPELTDAEARDFIHQAVDIPSDGKWTEKHIDEFLKQSGVYYPCFLVNGLLEIGVENPVEVAEFANIFSEQVRPDLHSDFYNQFNRRFESYASLPNGEQRELILPALKTVMESNEACHHEELECVEPFTGMDLALALEMMVEDGFIKFTEDIEGDRLWLPASRLSKLWWKRSKLS